MSEKKKRWLIIAVGVAIIVVLYYYLRNANNQPQLVTYPNTQSSGVPSSQNPASTWNIAVPSAAPSPAAIYAPPLPLPPTPNFMSYNNTPVNVTGPTTNYVQSAPATGCNGSSCGGCCGCASCPTGGTYGDGNSQTCLAPSPSSPKCQGTEIEQPDGTIGCYNPVVAYAASSLASFFGTPNTPGVPGAPTGAS